MVKEASKPVPTSLIREYGCKAPSIQNLGEMLSVRDLCGSEGSIEREYWEKSFAQKYLLISMKSFAAYLALWTWRNSNAKNRYVFGTRLSEIEMDESSNRYAGATPFGAGTNLREEFLSLLRTGATYEPEVIMTLPIIMPEVESSLDTIDCELSWDDFWSQKLYPVRCLGLFHDYGDGGNIFYGMERLGFFPGKNND